MVGSLDGQPLPKLRRELAVVLVPFLLKMKPDGGMTTIDDHNSGSGGKTQACPMCGERFFCGLSADCWCASLQVPPEVREYLAGRYETCVCKNCLEKLIRKSGNGESLSG